jgi:hypothetical protein
MRGRFLRLRIPFSYAVCLIGGTLVGAIFGDRVFPGVEAMFGDPATDIFFGFAGGFFAAVGYEMVAMFLRPD